MIPSIRQPTRLAVLYRFVWFVIMLPFLEFFKTFSVDSHIFAWEMKGKRHQTANELAEILTWAFLHSSVVSRHSSRLERIEFKVFLRDCWACAVLSVQRRRRVRRKKVMNDGWWSEAELSLHAKSGLGTCRRQAEASVCGSLEYLHVKARTEIF